MESTREVCRWCSLSTLCCVLSLSPCPCRLTGADLYALCSDAWMAALKRVIAQEEAVAQQQQQQATEQQDGEPPDGLAGGGGGGADQVLVTQADFVAAADAVQPSLSAEEVAKYEAIRDSYNSAQARAY